MQASAELISLVLAVPTILMSFIVVFLWRKQAIKTIKKGGPQTDVEYLITGITIGFVGSAFDNLYWGAAWTASFLRWESKDLLFALGVYSNIPFRQAAGMIAAYYHIVGSYSSIKERHKVIALLNITNAIVCILVTIILCIVKYGQVPIPK